jgi:CSLREA domain-containing protein
MFSKLWDDKELNSRRGETQATIVVNTLLDELDNDGNCSLREAIQAANTNASVDACLAGDVLTDTITFEVSGTIVVNTQLEVVDGGPLIIDGDGIITLSGQWTGRVITTTLDAELNLESIGVTHGQADQGGGVERVVERFKKRTEQLPHHGLGHG